MANYYDRVLEDFDLRESEGILDEGLYDEGIYDEGIYDEGIYDEGMFDEARGGKRRPERRPPGSMNKPSDFGKNMNRSSSQNRNFVTKAELKNRLDGISKVVNDLKKSSLLVASSVKRLDDGYEKIVKGIAKKDRSQDNMLSNTTMMSLMGTLINKPTFNPDALQIVPEYTSTNGDVVKEHIEVVKDKDPVQIDLMKTLMFQMLPSMMNSQGGSDNSMMMMLPLVMLSQNNGTSSSSGNTNSMLPLLLIPMMMNKK